MITKRKMLWSFVKFSQRILQGNVLFGEFVSGYKGLKGLTLANIFLSIDTPNVFSTHLLFFQVFLTFKDPCIDSDTFIDLQDELLIFSQKFLRRITES